MERSNLQRCDPSSKLKLFKRFTKPTTMSGKQQITSLKSDLALFSLSCSILTVRIDTETWKNFVDTRTKHFPSTLWWQKPVSMYQK